MDAIELLLSRASNGKLGEPAPDEETLALALRAAGRAPDHGTLRPWRITLVRGAARERLGQVLREALLNRKPGASAAELDKEQRRPLRAPLVMVVSARLTTHPKVPAVEQLLSTGVAASAVLLMLQARGYSGIWRTGAPAYDAHVKRALGLASSDAIVGFLYAGTPAMAPPPMARPTPETFVSEWHGPQEGGAG
jgi:nitroreductase